ncbi:MAG: sigma-70 family RNA polymerase sigma factor [Chloroflexia bacterium]|nr:sigma-70 family RNA polymerase sigma factor [Chloroflexia bacterium]
MLAAAPDHRLRALRPEANDSAPAPRDTGADELAIVRRAQHQPAAFAPLYERYVDAVFAYCYRRTSDREVAADLTHQIFARALTALPRFSERPDNGSFRGWLFAIARNLVIDTHRTRRETAVLDDIAGHDALRDPARSPEDHAIASEQRRTLMAAMAQLTAGQRQVVELRLAGLTGPEIAAALDLHLNAVKSTQFRAYARLRDLLGESLAFDCPASPMRETDHA